MGKGQEIKQEDLTRRIGTFLTLLGVLSFVFFLASDFANQPDFDWLFAGIVLTLIGISLRRRVAPSAPSGRFVWLKKLRNKSKQRKEKKAKK